MSQRFLGFDPTSLSTLSAQDAVHLFKSLLWCSARHHSLPLASITISSHVNVPDGGVDATIARNAITLATDMLVSGNSFFQIKAGASATPWRKSWVWREIFGSGAKPCKSCLGQEVRHCLACKGRYVLVCFGCDPTPSQRRRAIGNVRQAFLDCGYRGPRVDVWGQGTLEGLINQFPSLLLRLSNRDQLPFLTHGEWAHDAEMSRFFHLGTTQEQVLAQIRDAFRGAAVGHVRLIGEPGLGKTRLAMEALSAEDLAPTVVYVRDPEDLEKSPLFHAILRSDDASSMTLVVDDCPERERASIWNALKHRSRRIRLITLDHGPENSADDLMIVIQCPALESDKIEAILSDYIGPRRDTHRWAELCSGSPRVAHALGENLQRNPDDLLKSPASVPLWDRFIHGNSEIGSQAASQKESVLRHVALFHKLGFEHPVEEEAKFVASLVERADPAITWSIFQSIIKHFRDRRILQGKTTLFLVPKLLHVHLWCECWEHYGHDLDVGVLLSQMPQSLFRWFIEMFRYGQESPRCLSRIKQITSAGGPFDKPEFMASGPGPSFLNGLAEAHPEATLACVERTVGTWSHEDLLSFAGQRQYLVWALEKIAMWNDLFQRAAKMLQRLALAENATNGNNATGTFCGLFDMGRGSMASSQAPPGTRLLVLRAALSSCDRPTRSLALKALARALGPEPLSRIVGPEYQGLRQVPSLWTPGTWGELYDAYRAAWRLASEFRSASSGDDRAEVTTRMVDASHFLVRIRALEDEILGTLEQITLDEDTDPRALVALISRFRSQNWAGLSRKAATRLRALDRRIYGSTVTSAIVRVVLLGGWDDICHTKHSVKCHTRMLRRLARSSLAKKAELCSLLPRLSVERGIFMHAFGSELGSQDVSCSFWPTIRRELIAAGKTRNPELAAGYLFAVFCRDRTRWENLVLPLLEEKSLSHDAGAVVLGSGLTDRILNTVCIEIQHGDLPEEAVSGARYGLTRHGISLDRCTEFIRWCVAQGTCHLLNVALASAYQIFVYSKDSPAMPEQPILDLLASEQVLRAETIHKSDYEWAELAKRYLDSYPHHAIRLLGCVFDRFVDFRFVLKLRYSSWRAAVVDMILRDPKAAWEMTSARMIPLDGRLAQNLIHWLGPRDTIGESPATGLLSSFDITDVLAWVEIDPTKRPAFIARESPKTFAHDAGALTRELLIRYGEQDDVQAALWANFMADGWCGKASEHHRRKRDEMRNWLSSETAQPVIDWLTRHIEHLSNQIEHYEMQEEREF